MQFRIGAPVIAQDGQVGQVDRVILDPETGSVMGLIVVQGWLLSHDVALPSAWIEAADENGVRVAATSDQVDGLEPVTLAQYTDPPENWIPPDNAPGSQFLFPASPYAVGAFTMPVTQMPIATEEVLDLPGNQVAINDGTVVFCTDGEVGAVSRVVTQDGTGKMDLLIVDIGGLESRLVAVPLDRVTSIGDGQVNLALSVGELDSYPEWESPVASRAAA